MTRLLLTLLALLTGLVAQSAPASARVGGAAGAEVTIQLPGNRALATVARHSAGSRPSAEVWQVRVTRPLAQQRLAPTPTVRTGIDRARE